MNAAELLIVYDLWDPDAWQAAHRHRNLWGKLYTDKVPEPVSENTGEPEKVTVVWGNLTTRNITGGPARGDLEATLRYLVSLGPATEIGGSEASPGSAA
jgi:hypothetical protein